VQIYNNRPHRGERMWGFSPNEMDSVLTLHPGVTLEKIMARNNNTSSALTIAYYREDRVRSWLSALADESSEVTAVVHNTKDIQSVINTIGNFINNQMKCQQEALVRLEQMSQETIRYLETISQQSATIIEQQKEQEALRAKIEYMHNYIKEQDQKQRTKEAAAAKRKAAEKQERRDILTFSELQEILSLTQKHHKSALVKARVTLSFLLLYETGMRIGNLREFRVRHLKEFLDPEVRQTTLPLIKTRDRSRLSDTQTFVCTSAYLEVIKPYLPIIGPATRGKQDSDFVFF
jgi:hypothetical protein